MSHAGAQVLQFPAQQKRCRTQSQYERYPLPFFKAGDSGSGGCTWHVTPTGDYTADLKTGKQYGIQFVRTYDGTIGWATLLSCIVSQFEFFSRRRMDRDGAYWAG